jgi:hypothetical protein
MTLPESLFDRWIGRPRPWWVTAIIGLALTLPPFLFASLDSSLDAFLISGQWRGILGAPVMILFILVIAPRLVGSGQVVLHSLRSIVMIDDEAFERLIVQAVTIQPRDEFLAIGAGMLLGVLMSYEGLATPISASGLYWFLTTLLQYGLLAWVVYVAITSTRVTNVILRQPLRVDPFDPTPFQPIGRQSLQLALVFVGGMTISLLFVASQPDLFRQWEFWLIYIPLVTVTLLVFFLNMRPAHRAMASAKARELGKVGHLLKLAGQKLTEEMEAGRQADSLALQINALAVFEQRLQNTQTWPYNTAMLRTLFFSVLVPAATLLARVGFEWLQSQDFLQGLGILGK